MTVLSGRLVRLRPVQAGDVAALVRIRRTPEVYARWRGGEDLAAAVQAAVHGRGAGSDAVRTVCRHLLRDLGHHRLTIDPAADNEAAIRCYAKVGFRPVGVMRRYERASDGTWHDGLLMDLLADEFVDDEGPPVPGSP